MQRAMCRHALTSTLPVRISISTWTISSSSITTGGVSPHELCSRRPSIKTGRSTRKTDRLQLTTTTIAATSTRSSGLTLRNSPMLLTDLAILCCALTQSKPSSELSVHRLTLVINSSHSFKLQAWIPTPRSTSRRATPFTRIAMSSSGLASGRCSPSAPSASSQVSTSSRPTPPTVYPHLTGSRRSGVGSRSPNNSRMVVIGISKTSVTVTTTTT